MSDLDRKARLAAIRDNAAKGKGMDSTTEDAVPAPIKFRNYNPQDSALQPRKRPHPEEGEANNEENTNSDKPDSQPAVKNRKVEDADIIARELKELASDEINIVPKKPNWDLKNQLSSKLDKLRRRTQRSIVDILREKVAAEDEDDNLD